MAGRALAGLKTVWTGPGIRRVFEPLLKFRQIIEDYARKRAASGLAGAVGGLIMAAGVAAEAGVAVMSRITGIVLDGWQSLRAHEAPMPTALSVRLPIV